MTDSNGAQRQYLTSWQPSVVSNRDLKKQLQKFVVHASTADGKFHQGQYKESWEVADDFDKNYPDLVEEWTSACVELGINAPLSPPRPSAKRYKRVNTSAPSREKAKKHKAQSDEDSQNPAMSARELRARRRAGRT